MFMAAFLRASRRSLLSFQFSHGQHSSLHYSKFISQFSRSHASEATQKSPFESNILRILRNEVNYQLDYAPPHPPVTKFNTFMVEDRPGEQWITLRRKFGNDEHIKIEATMFDGSITVPKTSDENIGEDVRLHISVLVDIWKGEGSEFLEFVCSSWPNSLEIQKVYILRSDGSPAQPYMGPNVRDLDSGFRDGLNEFLKTRGINDELSAFLHEFMMNKDRTEAIEWLRKIQSFIEN
ncbi:PREDICTED: uncharacterized protein At2g39795, mitochondrial [Nicotiana attenuata]|uniref:Uncharacterized protein, mitochondrial n=1 Tax=Nicotiana attenuata TaxID=49451 RepID=A0A1J6IC08_NICAT|nr:PREDICTED: uncharacterized protein At2g39795, mitochondrial [Nicotiana attenuata]OIT02581.1 uncharacterized protein, mitochondrial [Nicotiana attenuata]